MARRRRRLGPLLLVAFVLIPLVEIYALIQVGQVIGPGWTILLLILDSAIGAWIIRREGSRAWRALRSALEGGRMPGKELADGALILVGGTLMLTPGFVTDAFGILVILPITRPLFRAVLTRVIDRRLRVVGPMPPGGFPGAPGGGNGRHPGPGSQGPVVRGEVVDDE